MGHSMAGGMVLSFATRTEAPPSKDTVALLSGVVASSPLVRIDNNKPGPFMNLVLKFCAKYFPTMPVDTPVQDKALSHDPAVGPSLLKDPWIKPLGTMQGIGDMLGRGELLLKEGYRLWPADLPVIILHGKLDKVNAYPPSKEFFGILQAKDKEFIDYEGALHDLMTEPSCKDKYFEDCVSWVEKHL